MYGYSGSLDPKQIALYLELEISPSVVYGPRQLLDLFFIDVAVQVLPVEGKRIPDVALAGNDHLVDLPVSSITDLLDRENVEFFKADNETWVIEGHDLAMSLAELVCYGTDIELESFLGRRRRYEAGLAAVKKLVERS